MNLSPMSSQPTTKGAEYSSDMTVEPINPSEHSPSVNASNVNNGFRSETGKTELAAVDIDPDATQLEVETRPLGQSFTNRRLLLPDCGDKFYENKQYKRGFKSCEQILRKYPDHGETLALKGLFLLFLGKREEGFDSCKKGLRLSLQSHISWHVLGLMYRQDKNYEEAIKCYKSALKIDKENIQILRDLALLQLQCRQFDGAIESRRRILFSRPTAPFSWISLVTTLHLAGNLASALDTLNVYLNLFGNINDPAENHRYYKLSLLMEMNRDAEALEYLSSSIQRKTSRRYYEFSAQLSRNLKHHVQCDKALIQLLDINPDERSYLNLYAQSCREQVKSMDEAFDEVAKRSQLAACEFLGLVDDQIFATKAGPLLLELLNKNSPGIFSLFEPQMKIDGRRELIWNCISSTEIKNASVEIFKAKHLSYIGDKEGALKVIGDAVTSFPACQDLQFLKASLFKDMRRNPEAVEAAMADFESSLQDKFAISKMAKYQLRFGSIERAQEMIGAFIQKSSAKEKMADLHEMQAGWYLIEMANRLMTEDKLLLAACFYRKINLIFDEFIDDQLDFHNYSLRRMSFIEYIKFLRYLDGELRLSHLWKKGLVGVAKCILSMSVDPTDSLINGINALSISLNFADDISTHLDHFRSLLSSPTRVSEALYRISNILIKNHSHDPEAIEICLEIAVKRKSMLSAYKYARHLEGLGIGTKSDLKETFENLRQTDDTWKLFPTF